MSQTQMISTTQVFARPRHQFMPNWMPRSQHGHKQYSQSQGGQVNVTSVPVEFDGKRLRKPVARKTVDYNSSMHEWLQERLWQRDHRDKAALQPDPAYQMRMGTPSSMNSDPSNVVTSKFVRAATNKMKCPVFCVTWTPEGRRLITGASSGEFTLWNGLTFNFETILQAHDLPVRCMTWSRNDQWMVTGDHGGYIKYWQTNMNNVRMFQGHKEAVRGISFCPTDMKFTSCSDDGTVRVWDFAKCDEERILRGHGSDVKCVDWHPQKSLIVSGSKDSQQPIKLWCPKSGQSIATIHAHKSTVMDARWNRNGNWLITASRDHLIKLFDVRKLNVELQTFRGHKREACTLAWHTVHEEVFASGGSDGSVMFWTVGTDKEVGSMDQAHDSCVWSLAWHPVGHILCTGSNDHTSKFWTRNRPGDKMRDRYNLNTLPRGLDDLDEDIPGMHDRNASQDPYIPGMGIDADQLEKLREGSIPGLDDDRPQKKMPHSKPIHKGFQQQWMENRAPVTFKDGEGKQSSNPSKQDQSDMKVDRPPPPPHMMPPDMRHPPPDGMMPGLHMPPPNWMEGGLPFMPPPGPMGFPMGAPPFMNQGGPFRHPPPPRPPGDQWGGPPDGWRPPGDWDANGNGDWNRGPGNWNHNNNNNGPPGGGPPGGGPMWRPRGRGAPRGMRGPLGNMPRRGGNGAIWR